MAHDSLFDADARRLLLDRLGKLSVESRARWGSMSVGAALAHLSDQLRFATGELRPAGPRGPLTWGPVKWFGIAVAPWPRGRLQASDELLQTPPAVAFEEGRQELARLMDKFLSTPRDELGAHPMFGALSPSLWGILAYRHLDHHLRQFGA